MSTETVALLDVVVALQDHRHRIARLLDGLDQQRTAGATGVTGDRDPAVDLLLQRFSERLRAGEDRLGWLVAQIERAPFTGTGPNTRRQPWT
jgi:hypothetical protein